MLFIIFFFTFKYKENDIKTIEISSNFMSNFELKSKNNLIGYFLIRNTLTKT